MKIDLQGSLRKLEEHDALFLERFAHGSLKVEIYKPLEVDRQQPHSQDELYVIAAGTSRFSIASEEFGVAAGDVLFVPAGTEHRFIDFSGDFSTWVFFYGPKGGERGDARPGKASQEVPPRECDWTES